MTKLTTRLLCFFILLLPMAVSAATPVPSWQMVPKQSSITFTATQNNAPVTGEFKSFSGDIKFDPTQLGASSASIVVDTTSVTASYGQVADTLKSPDWFDVKRFPQAIFKVNSFTKTGNNTYQANGILTIRDKAVPITLAFVLAQYTPTQALVKGNVTIKRTLFGVGQGEWAQTDQVKDEVQINFTITATKK